ncbi:hypothetical protein NQ318_012314, partial [Aromia moschata]
DSGTNQKLVTNHCKTETSGPPSTECFPDEYLRVNILSTDSLSYRLDLFINADLNSTSYRGSSTVPPASSSSLYFLLNVTDFYQFFFHADRHQLCAERYESWMKAIGRDPKENLSITHNAICSDHFTQDSHIYVDDKRVLKKFALLSVNLKPVKRTSHEYRVSLRKLAKQVGDLREENKKLKQELKVSKARSKRLSDKVDHLKDTLLGNPKDKINNNEKSGIYEISCKDCDQKYIGQTKRSILTRFNEHMAHLKYGRTEKSCVAQHAFENNHRIDINNLKLIRNVTNSRQLDAFESLEIIKCNNSMNKDNGPIPTSPLFALINKDSYGSVNRGNKFGINSAIKKNADKDLKSGGNTHKYSSEKHSVEGGPDVSVLQWLVTSFSLVPEYSEC